MKRNKQTFSVQLANEQVEKNSKWANCMSKIFPTQTKFFLVPFVNVCYKPLSFLFLFFPPLCALYIPPLPFKYHINILAEKYFILKLEWFSFLLAKRSTVLHHLDSKFICVRSDGHMPVVLFNQYLDQKIQQHTHSMIDPFDYCWTF